jgi:hypothetical protein
MSEAEELGEEGTEASQSTVAEHNGSGYLIDMPQPQFQAPHFAPLVGHVGPELRTITNAHQFLPKTSNSNKRSEINEEVYKNLNKKVYHSCQCEKGINAFLFLATYLIFNLQVLAALTRVAEELNLAQAEFEYRKQLKREVQRC